jgi:hypothetical protein
VKLFVSLHERTGRRFLTVFKARRLTATCEDASTHRISITHFGRTRLDEDGSFEIENQEALQSVLYRAVGTVRFRRASGTFEFRFANLNQKGDAQLCTTGDLSWSAERVRPDRR